MRVVVILLVLVVVFYLLYLCGIMPIRSMKSLAYVGTFRGASVTKCTGYIKRILRVRQSKLYHLLLDSKISEGNIKVEILDSSKKRIVVMDKDNISADVDMEKFKKYYIIVYFENVTGSYKLKHD